MGLFGFKTAKEKQMEQTYTRDQLKNIATTVKNTSAAMTKAGEGITANITGIKTATGETGQILSSTAKAGESAEKYLQTTAAIDKVKDNFNKGYMSVGEYREMCNNLGVKSMDEFQQKMDTHFSTLVNNNMAQGNYDQLFGENASKITSVIKASGADAKTSATSSSSTLAESAKSAFSTVGNFANTVADKASGAANYVAGLVDKVGNSINTMAQNALAKATNMVNKIGGIADKANNWFNEMTAPFTGGKGKTATSPVKSGYVTSNNKEGVDPANLEKAQGGFFSGLKNITSSVAGKFKELAGGASNLFNAVKNVKDKVVGMATNIVSTGKQIAKTVQNTIMSPIRTVTNAIKNVKNLVNPANIRSMVQSNLNFLPAPISGFIANKAGNLTSGLYKKISKVENKLTSFGQKVYKATSLSTYLNNNTFSSLIKKKNSSTYSYSNGVEIIGTETTKNVELSVGNSDADVGQIKTMYNTAAELCPNVDKEIVEDLEDNVADSGAYMAMIETAIDNGSADLLEQLSKCTAYFDTNTKQLISSLYSDASKSGNSTLVEMMLKITGANNVKNAMEILLKLGTNLNESNEKTTIPVLDATGKPTYDKHGKQVYKTVTEQQIIMYKSVLRALNISAGTLLQNNSEDKSMSGVNMTLLSRKPQLAESVIIESLTDKDYAYNTDGTPKLDSNGKNITKIDELNATVKSTDTACKNYLNNTYTPYMNVKDLVEKAYLDIVQELKKEDKDDEVINKLITKFNENVTNFINHVKRTDNTITISDVIIGENYTNLDFSNKIKTIENNIKTSLKTKNNANKTAINNLNKYEKSFKKKAKEIRNTTLMIYNYGQTREKEK